MIRTFSVLLVDDVADLRFLLRAALEGSPSLAVTAEAEDGEQAVRLAATHQPDLVVLDLAMPVQDGLITLPKILKASPHSKVIILSAFEGATFESEAKRLGAAAYLEKGIAPEQLVRAVEEILGSPRSAGPARP